MSSVVLKDVSLDFKLYRQKGIKDVLTHRAHDMSEISVVHALRNIDLQLRDGDRLGVIGHNGAGKSTPLVG